MPRGRPRKTAAALAEPTTAIAVLESGGSGEDALDTTVVDQAVAHINRLYAGKGLETARAIGEYVLQTFFEGDPGKYREKGSQHVSFRALAKREDLFVSYSFISRACGIVEQLRLLPPDIASALPLEHHRLLLPLKDEKAKVKLAQEAVDKQLPKRAFAERVQKVRAKETQGSKAGRPPLPAFAKAFTRLSAVAKLARSEDITDATFRNLPREKAQQLLLEAEDQIERLQKVIGQLRAKLQEQAKAPEPEVVYEEEGA